jgi:hypothetical protein
MKTNHSFLSHLKKGSFDKDIRWIVKTTPQGNVREVKQVYDPEDYKKGKRSRKLLNKEELITILEENGK